MRHTAIKLSTLDDPVWYAIRTNRNVPRPCVRGVVLEVKPPEGTHTPVIVAIVPEDGDTPRVKELGSAHVEVLWDIYLERERQREAQERALARGRALIDDEARELRQYVKDVGLSDHDVNFPVEGVDRASVSFAALRRFLDGFMGYKDEEAKEAKRIQERERKRAWRERNPGK